MNSGNKPRQNPKETQNTNGHEQGPKKSAETSIDDKEGVSCEDEIVKSLQAFSKKHFLTELSPEAIAELRKLSSQQLAMLQRLSKITIGDDLRWLLTVAPLLNKFPEEAMVPDAQGQMVKIGTGGILEASIDDFSKRYDPHFYSYLVNHDNYVPANKVIFPERSLLEAKLGENLEPGLIDLKERLTAALRQEAPRHATTLGVQFRADQLELLVQGVANAIWDSGYLSRINAHRTLSLGTMLLKSDMIDHQNHWGGLPMRSRGTSFAPKANLGRIFPLAQWDPYDNAIENEQRNQLATQAHLRVAEKVMRERLLELGKLPQPSEDTVYGNARSYLNEVLKNDLFQKDKIKLDEKGNLLDAESKENLARAISEVESRIVAEASRRSALGNDWNRAENILKSDPRTLDIGKLIQSLKIQVQENDSVNSFLAQKKSDTLPVMNVTNTEDFRHLEQAIRDAYADTRYEANEKVRGIMRTVVPQMNLEINAEIEREKQKQEKEKEKKPSRIKETPMVASKKEQVEKQVNEEQSENILPVLTEAQKKGFKTVSEARSNRDLKTVEALTTYLNAYDDVLKVLDNDLEQSIADLADEYIQTHPKNGSDEDKLRRHLAVANAIRHSLTERQHYEDLAHGLLTPFGDEILRKQQPPSDHCMEEKLLSRSLENSAGDRSQVQADLKVKAAKIKSEEKRRHAEISNLKGEGIRKLGIILKDGGTRIAWEQMPVWNFKDEDWQKLSALQFQLNGEDLIEMRDRLIRQEHEYEMERDIMNEEDGGLGGNGNVNAFRYQKSKLAIKASRRPDGDFDYTFLDFEQLKLDMSKRKKKIEHEIRYGNTQRNIERTSVSGNYLNHMFNKRSAKYTGEWLQWLNLKRSYPRMKIPPPSLPPTHDTPKDIAADLEYNKIAHAITQFKEDFGTIEIEGGPAARWANQWQQQLQAQNKHEAELLKQAIHEINSMPLRVAEFASFFIGGEFIGVIGRGILRGAQWVRFTMVAEKSAASAAGMARAATMIRVASQGLKQAEKIAKAVDRANHFALKAQEAADLTHKLTKLAEEARAAGDMQKYYQYVQQAIQHTKEAASYGKTVATSTKLAAKLAQSAKNAEHIKELTASLSAAEKELETASQAMTGARLDGLIARSASVMSKAPLAVQNAIKRGVQLEALGLVPNYISQDFNLGQGGKYWGETRLRIKNPDDPDDAPRIVEGTWKELLAKGRIKNLPYLLDRNRDGIPDFEQGLGGPEIRFFDVLDGAAAKTRLFLLSPAFSSIYSKIPTHRMPGLRKFMAYVDPLKSGSTRTQRASQWVYQYMAPAQWAGMSSAAGTNLAMDHQTQEEFKIAMKEIKEQDDWGRFWGLVRQKGLDAVVMGFMANDLDRGFANLLRSKLVGKTFARELAVGAAAYAPNAAMSFAHPYLKDFLRIDGNDMLDENEAKYMRGFRSLLANVGSDGFAVHMAMRGINPASLEPASKPNYGAAPVPPKSILPTPVQPLNPTGQVFRDPKFSAENLRKIAEDRVQDKALPMLERVDWERAVEELDGSPDRDNILINGGDNRLIDFSGISPDTRKKMLDAYLAGRISKMTLKGIKIDIQHGVIDEKDLDQRLNEIDKNERDLGVLEEIIAGVPVSRSLNNKIAQGRQKEGTREVIGAHSADILNYPREYQILDNYTNVNGTIVAHIRIRIIDPNTGLETWSKATKRTLAPKTWTYPDLEEATSIVGKPFNYIYTRKRDGSRLYRARVNGIEWEVWRDKDGYVTSSYPTGN